MTMAFACMAECSRSRTSSSKKNVHMCMEGGRGDVLTASSRSPPDRSHATCAVFLVKPMEICNGGHKKHLSKELMSNIFCVMCIPNDWTRMCASVIRVFFRVEEIPRHLFRGLPACLRKTLCRFQTLLVGKTLNQNHASRP